MEENVYLNVIRFLSFDTLKTMLEKNKNMVVDEMSDKERNCYENFSENLKPFFIPVHDNDNDISLYVIYDNNSSSYSDLNNLISSMKSAIEGFDNTSDKKITLKLDKGINIIPQILVNQFKILMPKLKIDF